MKVIFESKYCRWAIFRGYSTPVRITVKGREDYKSVLSRIHGIDVEQKSKCITSALGEQYIELGKHDAGTDSRIGVGFHGCRQVGAVTCSAGRIDATSRLNSV